MGRSLDEAIDKVLRIIIQEVDPDAIILFGSKARGDDDDNSDIDLLIVKDGASRTMLRKVYDSLSGIDVPVDMIIVDGERLKENMDDPYMIYGQAFREGKMLYAKA